MNNHAWLVMQSGSWRYVLKEGKTNNIEINERMRWKFWIQGTLREWGSSWSSTNIQSESWSILYFIREWTVHEATWTIVRKRSIWVGERWFDQYYKLRKDIIQVACGIISSRMYHLDLVFGPWLFRKGSPL